jgi:predicted transcriptional regulator
MNQDYCLHLVEITKESKLKIWFYLLAHLEKGNWVPLSPTLVADALNLNKQTVTKAFKKLQEDGVLEKAARIGKQYMYRIPPKVSWKGKSADHKKAFDVDTNTRAF